MQVLLSYGTYTNLELLEHYGFLLQENPNDKAFISLEPEMNSLCSFPRDSLYISHYGRPSFTILSTLRLWATPFSKRRSVKHITYSGNQLSNENEVAVMQWIAYKCRALLSCCTTSIDEDAALLQIIDKIQDYNWEEESSSPAVRNEIRAFLERNRVMSREQFSAKTRRCMYKWKLAVEWRHRYKRILNDCILYCSRLLDNSPR